MRQRVITALFFGAIYVGLGLLGGVWLTLGLGVLLLLGIYEFWRLCRQHDLQIRLEAPAAVGLGLLMILTVRTEGIASVAGIHAAEPVLGLALAVLFLAVALGEVLRGRIEQATVTAALTVLTGVYIAFPLAYMILLRRLPGGAGTFYFFLLTVATWANDSFAYFGGMILGRHRLAPAISPKKTIEGSAAGLIASLLAGLILALSSGRSPGTAMGLAVLVGVLGQAGDLFESLLKRDLGVKDTGTILPGHGGVLDRFDSLLFAAPAVYYFAAYLAA